MKKSTLYKVLGVVICYGLAFGLVLPYLVSAKSSVALALGLLGMAALIFVPTISFISNLTNESSK